MEDYIDQFLVEYPRMSLVPSLNAGTRLSGYLSFRVNIIGAPSMDCCYKLDILIPREFPASLPIVKETENKIPRDGTFHVNPDGSLCLGSPLRLLMIANQEKTLSGYVDKCLIPYLYAVTNRLCLGGKFCFGELVHGENGILDDYRDLLGLQNNEQVRKSIDLLGLKKFCANKERCPCGCGELLKDCMFQDRLNKFRGLAPREWFKNKALKGK